MSGNRVTIYKTAAKAVKAFTDVEDSLMGRGGESMVTNEMLKHVVTRVTDEGKLAELKEKAAAKKAARKKTARKVARKR